MAGALGMESSGVQLQGAELKGLCKQRSIMKEETNYKQKNKRNYPWLNSDKELIYLSTVS